MTAVTKSVYFDVLDDIVNKYSIKVHRLSDEGIKPPTTSNEVINPLVNYVRTKIRVNFTFNQVKMVNIYIVYEIERSVN